MGEEAKHTKTFWEGRHQQDWTDRDGLAGSYQGTLIRSERGGIAKGFSRCNNAPKTSFCLVVIDFRGGNGDSAEEGGMVPSSLSNFFL